MNNFEFRIIVNDINFTIDESYEVEKLENESIDEYEKRAFKEYHKARIELSEFFEWFELRKYDLDNEEYLDWEMIDYKIL